MLKALPDGDSAGKVLVEDDLVHGVDLDLRRMDPDYRSSQPERHGEPLAGVDDPVKQFVCGAGVGDQGTTRHNRLEQAMSTLYMGILLHNSR